MKTKAIVLSAALALANLTSFASGEEGNAEKSVKKSFFSIENQFMSKLSSPSFVRQEMAPQTAFIQFHITNRFEVVIDNMVCTDNRLKSHIEKELAKEVILIDRENVNRSYSIKMTFK